MAEIDIEALLSPVSPDKPTGVDLDEVADADFEAVRQIIASAGAPGGMVSTEENGSPKEADWREVRQRSLQVLTRSKDVRVVNFLTLALLRQAGIPGLRDGLSLLRGMLERYWEGVYPQLDREDNNDPTRRMNAVAALSPAGSFGDTMRFSERLRQVALCNSRRNGRFSMLDIDLATGQAQPVDPSQPKPEISVIEAAFADTDVAQLEALTAAAGEAKEQLAAIDRFLTERVGNGQSPNLSAFATALAQVHTQLQRHLNKRTGGDPMPEASNGDEPADAPGGGGAPQRLSGEISSTRDVLAALEKISRYYESNEKSSPVPLFIECARQLVYKSFLDIYDRLSPEAVQQLRTISGAGAEPPAG